MKQENQVIQKNINVISFMVRPEKNNRILKLNVQKSFDGKIEAGKTVYSHSIKDVHFGYKILEVIEERQSSMKDYNYCTYKVKPVKIKF